MESERRSPSVGEELASFKDRLPQSFGQRRHGEKGGQLIAETCLSQIVTDDRLRKTFGFSPTDTVERIGQGWNGGTYKVGKSGQVIKIAYDFGPVKGFGFEPTPEGAAAAQRHLNILKRKAEKHGLEQLIDQNQEIVYLPPVESIHNGKVVVIQPYYEQLLNINKLPLHNFTRKQTKALFEEFHHFIDFVNDLSKNEGLTPDLFGFGNLAITIDKAGNPHLVLPDIGVADHEKAGKVTLFGLKASAFLQKMGGRVLFALEGHIIPDDVLHGRRRRAA